MTLAPLLWAMLISATAADEESSDLSERRPLLYKDKTAAQWINQLGNSGNEDARVEAAEALGFLAREGRLTAGRFSDVPLDSPEPPQLSKEAVRPIVAALIAGLNDSHGRVRASSAVALSWIGSRAKAAVPALSHLLKDGDKDARESALLAIGAIGPSAEAASSILEPMLARGDASSRIKVARAMRLIGAAPDSFVPTLIAALSQGGDSSPAHYAAMELGQLGDPAVPALKRALRDKDSITRNSAAYAIGNMAGWGKLTKDRESVADALIELTREDDPKLVWRAAQAIGSVQACPERSVPALVLLLKHKDAAVVNEAVESLGDFGAAAKPSLPALIGLLRDGREEHVRMVDYAIRQIGLDRDSADVIRTLKLAEQGSWLFIPLCEYPDAAVEFLQANPHVVDVPARDHEALIRVMRDPDRRFKKLQEMLYNSEELPLPVVAELGDPRFLLLLERKLKTASPHERTQLDACARACGAQAKRVVAISESQPGDFKPRSAWPGSDPARVAPKSAGHGDGITTVIVTGQILREGDVPAVTPKFYRVNDAMLLGDRTHEEVPITFNQQTGHFVFVTAVFGAYSSGDGQREAGPYQTGSSIVLIESKGCKPLQVRFYDEMPEVRITLSGRDNIDTE